jgi:stress-induced-phosphoprotein 1
MSKKQQAEQAKEKGNKAFGEQNFTEAIKWYTEAIKCDPKNHVYYSNRSAAYSGLKQWGKALEDAELCVRTNKQWGKGYYRKAVALLELGRTDEAIRILQDGLAVDGGNSDIRSKLAQLESEREKKTKFVGEDGMPLTGMALAKAEGNDHFKFGRYEDAIACYTRALELTTDTAERAILYSNRAAAWGQYQNHSKIVEDCNSCLALDPRNAKALMRRGQAYEGLEKYPQALADFKSVLELDPSAVKASAAIARLSRFIR